MSGMRLRGISRWITHTLLLSIIPVVLFGTIIYELGTHMVQEEIHRFAEKNLAQIMYQTETRMRNIEQLANQFSLQPSTLEIVNTGMTPSLGTTFAANHLIASLAVMKTSVDYIDSVYLFHIPQQLVFTSKLLTKLGEKRLFSDESWLDNLDQMTTEKKQRQWVAPRELTDNGEQRPVLTYLSVLPYFADRPKAALIVNMKADFLDSIIGSLPMEKSGTLLVYNEQHTLISATGGINSSSRLALGVQAELNNETTLEGTRTLQTRGLFVSMMRSSYTGWTYVVTVPASVPRQSVDLFRRLLIFISIALVVLTILSAYFSHTQFQKRVRRVAERLFPPGQTKPGDTPPIDGSLENMEHHILQLVQENMDNRIRAQSRLPLLQTHYMYAAIYGNAVDLSKISGQDTPIGLFPHARFVVIVVEMDLGSGNARFSGEDPLFSFAVTNIADELASRNRESLAIGTLLTNWHAVIILNMAETVSVEQEAVAFAEQLRTVVKHYLKMTVTIGVGTIVEAIADVAGSYRAALQILQGKWGQAGDAVLTLQSTSIMEEKLIQYPSTIEQQLLAALRARDLIQARLQLDAFRQALDQGNCPQATIKTCCMQLLVAVVRLGQSYHDDLSQVFGGNPYETFFQLKTLSDVVRWMDETLFPTMHSFLESVKRSKTAYLIERTLELIEERYATDLSLQLAADELGISPSHLSQLFKEETGESFIERVTNKRIEKAQQLLTQTDLPLALVAEAIGYTSVQQLFRVFKKKFDITPGEYRERQAGTPERTQHTP